MWLLLALSRQTLEVEKTNETKRDLISNATALGRVSEPEDIGGVVAFLCTEDAGWINGQRIKVSGGVFL